MRYLIGIIALIFIFSYQHGFLLVSAGGATAQASEQAYDTFATSKGPIPVISLGTVQTVDYTSASAATSSVIGTISERTVVMILCTTDCHLVLGASPTATTSLTRLPANTLLWIWVTGGVDEIAFIRATADGKAFVTEGP